MAWARSIATDTSVCRVTGGSRGASWAPDNTIVFATSDPATGLLRVPAAGGEPAVLTTPDSRKGESDHFFPSVLPGGRGVLFSVFSEGLRVRSQVAVLDLKSGSRKTLIQGGTQPEDLETGHLVYVVDGSLWAVPFDLATLDVPRRPGAEGGRTPVWAPSGRELFFVNGSSLMSVAIEPTPAFHVGAPVKLVEDPSLLLDGRSFTTGAHRTYDVASDGQRFLMMTFAASYATGHVAGRMVVVQNWREELKRLAPTP